MEERRDPAGTVLVEDINPGAVASNPTFLADFNSTLVFVASDAASGRELWQTKERIR